MFLYFEYFIVFNSYSRYFVCSKPKRQGSFQVDESKWYKDKISCSFFRFAQRVQYKIDENNTFTVVHKSSEFSAFCDFFLLVFICSCSRWWCAYSQSDHFYRLDQIENKELYSHFTYCTQISIIIMVSFASKMRTLFHTYIKLTIRERCSKWLTKWSANILMKFQMGTNTKYGDQSWC